MLSRQSNLLAKELQAMRETRYLLRSVNEVNPQAARAIVAEQLKIGASLLAIRKIVEEYHPEAVSNLAMRDVLADDDMDAPLRLEADDHDAIQHTDHVVAFGITTVAGQPQLAKAYPQLQNSESSSMKVSLVNHKVADAGNLVDVNLDAGLVLETGADGNDRYLSMASLNDKPLFYCDLDAKLNLKDVKLAAAYLEQGRDRAPVLMIASPKATKFLNDFEDLKDGKLTERFVEDHGVHYEEKTGVKITDTPFCAQSAESEVAFDLFIKDNQLSIVVYKVNSGGKSEIKVPEVKVTQPAQIRSAAIYTVGNSSLLVILTAAGDLVLKDAGDDSYSYLKLPASDYRCATFVKDLDAVFVLATAASQGNTKATVFKVVCPRGDANIGKESLAFEAIVAEPNADGLKFGAAVNRGQPAFLLIFANGRMHRVEQGKTSSEGVICDPTVARVADVRTADSKDGKAALYAVLQSPTGKDKAAVYTVAKITFN